MAESRHRVTIDPIPRRVGTEWLLDALFPNSETGAIKGFKTQAEANEWLGSCRHLIWLRDKRAGLGAWTTFRRLRASLLRFPAHHHWQSRSSALRMWMQGMSNQVLVRSLGGAKLLESTFRVRGARWHGLITAGAVMTIFVAALSFGPLAKSPKQEAATEPALGSGSIVRPEIGVGSEPDNSQSMEASYVSDPIGSLIDLSSISHGAASPPVKPKEAEAEPARQGLGAPVPGEQAATIVGMWAPDGGACSVRDFRAGLLPAIINTDGARAGDTSCTFKNQKQTATDWRVVANCSSPHEQWTANVRLTVKGNRLIWKSKRGAQAYTRCAMNGLR